MTETAMGEVVDLKRPALVEDHEFVVDLARFRENLLDEKAIRKKYRMFDDTVWEKLGDDDELIRKVEEESVRRIRDGSSKREKSQQLITKAPDILDGIASDTAASPRHRVDAIKTLDGMAANGPAAAGGQSDRFIITIVMNDQVLKFDKSISINPHDSDPFNDTNTTLEETAFTAIATKKTDGDDDESV
jgi:hypothetical protein